MGRLPAFEVSFETESSLKSQMRQNTPGETWEGLVSVSNETIVRPVRQRRVRGGFAAPRRTGEGERGFAMSSSACRQSGSTSVCSWCRSARGSKAGERREVSFETESSLKSQMRQMRPPRQRRFGTCRRGQSGAVPVGRAECARGGDGGAAGIRHGFAAV